MHIGQLVNNGLFKKWIYGKFYDLEYDIASWKTSFFRTFIILGTVVAFRAQYTHRMLYWKREEHHWEEHHWEEHHYRSISLRRMRSLGALKKKLFALPDPTPQVLSVSTDIEELQRAADW